MDLLILLGTSVVPNETLFDQNYIPFVKKVAETIIQGNNQTTAAVMPYANTVSGLSNFSLTDQLPGYSFQI